MWKLILGALLFLLPASAVAVPVTWELSAGDFQVRGGGPVLTGSLSGTFVYDADTGSYSDINIVATGYDASIGGVYSHLYASIAVPSSANGLFVGEEPTADIGVGDSLIFFGFGTPLANAGGTFFDGDFSVLNCSGGTGGSCTLQDVGQFANPVYRSVAPLPVPAMLPLFLAGIAALAGLSWRCRPTSRG